MTTHSNLFVRGLGEWRRFTKKRFTKTLYTGACITLYTKNVVHEKEACTHQQASDTDLQQNPDPDDDIAVKDAV